MREIKFRAWDEETKMMFYDGTASAGRFYVDWAHTPDSVNKSFDEFMQFTGLQDKNGKEIYEGDVLRGMYGEQQKEPLREVLGKVVFSRGAFEVGFGVTRRSLDEMDGSFAIYWCDHGHMNIPNYYYRIEDIEVIGNIYETPNLLK